jgi:protein-tyrosine-phosphatase
MEDRELIWVDSKSAAEYKSLETDETKELFIKNLLENKKISIDEELKLLDEHKLQFQAICLTYKNEIKKIYEVENEKLYSLWEEIGDISEPFRKNSDKLKSEVDQISKSVDQLASKISATKEAMANLNIYGADRLVELANTIASMDEGSKDILMFLAQNYKRD